MNTRNIIKSLLILFLVLGLVHTTPAKPVYAGTITVTTLDDENDGSDCPGSDCSLREAITLANTGDIIDFAVTGTITLTLGELMPSNISISGPGPGSLTIDGNNASRVFNIIGSTTVSISGVTITQGRVVDGDGGGILNNGNLTLDNVILTDNHAVKNASMFVDGGGVHNNTAGTLTITNSQVLNNTANFTGGGISSSGSLSINNVVITGNTAIGDGAGGNGGGISFDNNPSATAFINNTTFSLNSGNNGGALYTTNFNTVDISNSLFTNNEAVFGGGAMSIGGASSQYTLTNVTISGNSATNAGSGGGGIFTDGGIGMTATLNHVSIVNNTVAGSFGGGGIFEFGSATLILKNSILTDNVSSTTTDEDCVGAISSQDYNIIGDANGSCTVSGTTTNNQIGITGVTNPLADNGGPTETHSISSGSAATDAIPDGINGCGTTVTVDQRGAGRPSDGNGDTTEACDIGAFELDAIAPQVLSIVRTSTNPTTAASANYLVTFSEVVTDVDVDDFSITVTNGSLTGNTVSNVSGSGGTRTVTVTFGSGSGIVRLDVPTSATYKDFVGNDDLGLAFTAGQEYTKAISSTFKSAAANDGWVLESTETSNTGGTLNSSQTSFILGDDATDKQYRAILHFDTSALPDTAIITSMTLKVKQQGAITGTNPFSVLGSLHVDMRNPAFGNAPLELTDFNFAAKKIKSAVFNPTPVSGWYSARFNNGGNLYINRAGVSQLRLYFSVDDNNNNIADFIRFASGNAAAGDRPKLLISYYVP